MGVVVAQIRIQQVWGVTSHGQLEAAEIASVAMKESERLVRRIEDVAADVEYREALRVGENARRAARDQRGGQNVIFRPDFHDCARLARLPAQDFTHFRTSGNGAGPLHLSTPLDGARLMPDGVFTPAPADSVDLGPIT